MLQILVLARKIFCVRELQFFLALFCRMEENVSDCGCSTVEEYSGDTSREIDEKISRCGIDTLGSLVKEYVGMERPIGSLEKILDFVGVCSESTQKPEEFLYVQKALYSLVSEETADTVFDFWIERALTNPKQLYMFGLMWVHLFREQMIEDESNRLDLFVHDGRLLRFIVSQIHLDKYVEDVWVRVIACMIIRTSLREKLTELLVETEFLKRTVESSDHRSSIASTIVYFMLTSGADPEKISAHIDTDCCSLLGSQI
jgi:hypothetical protein